MNAADVVFPGDGVEYNDENRNCFDPGETSSPAPGGWS